MQCPRVPKDESPEAHESECRRLLLHCRLLFDCFFFCVCYVHSLNMYHLLCSRRQKLYKYLLSPYRYLLYVLRTIVGLLRLIPCKEAYLYTYEFKRQFLKTSGQLVLFSFQVSFSSLQTAYVQQFSVTENFCLLMLQME